MASKRTRSQLYWYVTKEHATGNPSPWYAEDLYRMALNGVSDSVIRSDRHFQELAARYDPVGLRCVNDPDLWPHRRHADQIRDDAILSGIFTQLNAQN